MIINKQMQRLTQQRKIILEELQKVYTHPTAEEIYEMVRARLPRISLATVYRNLEALEEAGLVLKLQAKNNGKARYDGDVKRHCHLVCKGCSKVIDIFDCQIQVSSKEIKEHNFFVISDHLEIPGFCQKCNPNSND
jgi:Fur family ferric uptake transcriptional regulator